MNRRKIIQFFDYLDLIEYHIKVFLFNLFYLKKSYLGYVWFVKADENPEIPKQFSCYAKMEHWKHKTSYSIYKRLKRNGTI